MQRAYTVQRVQAGRPAMVSVKPRTNSRAVLVRSAPKKEQIDQAVKDAEEACDGGDAGECASAWDTVEELSAAASHAKDNAQKEDPLEKFCEDDPSADECRVYED
ncbi:Calvin cycle protein CP12 [Picochlorum sp. SENEW3]|nr:Calvin cycle protein CP12 [Picochlorum sp. SENEW3]WPT18429.1 Calvin cycle protein CP12 [Picochlorum sp. SENEW3]